MCHHFNTDGFCVCAQIEGVGMEGKEIAEQIQE